MVAAGRAAGAPPERFEAGDVLVVPHGDAYYLADPPTAERTAFRGNADFLPPHGCGQVAIDGLRGWRRTGNDAIHLRFLGCDLRPFNPVLSGLPRLLRVRPATQTGDGLSHLIAFAIARVARATLGWTSREVANGGVAIRRCHPPSPRNVAWRRSWLARRVAQSTVGARAGFAASRTGAPLDARYPHQERPVHRAPCWPSALCISLVNRRCST